MCRLVRDDLMPLLPALFAVLAALCSVSACSFSCMGFLVKMEDSMNKVQWCHVDSRFSRPVAAFLGFLLCGSAIARLLGRPRPDIMLYFLSLSITSHSSSLPSNCIFGVYFSSALFLRRGICVGRGILADPVGFQCHGPKIRPRPMP